jgi:hypothetical protein
MGDWWDEEASESEDQRKERQEVNEEKLMQHLRQLERYGHPEALVCWAGELGICHAGVIRKDHEQSPSQRRYLKACDVSLGADFKAKREGAFLIAGKTFNAHEAQGSGRASSTGGSGPTASGVSVSLSDASIGPVTIDGSVDTTGQTAASNSQRELSFNLTATNRGALSGLSLDGPDPALEEVASDASASGGAK